MPLVTVERLAGLILYGIETILFPYAVLLKGVVQAGCLTSKLQDRIRGRTSMTIFR
jgi:hypothetical protein